MWKPGSVDLDNVDAIKQQAMQFVDLNAELIRQLALDIHARPEPNYEEVFASARATEVLDEFGFDVEHGVADLPTAFVATCRGTRPGPTVGLVAEYDCVPDVGHGCGHNLICAATVAAGMGLSSVSGALPGVIKVFGTPAEEGGKGKMPMAGRGVFEHLDAALQFHPATRAGVTTVNMLAQNIFCSFRGTPAHTTAVPWEGLNALDAVIAVFNGVNAMRQQVHPDIRITGIITDGPTTIASIPERAAAMFRVRGFDEAMVLEVVERVKDCARGAALQTGTRVEIGHEPVEPALRCSETLTELFTQAGTAFEIAGDDRDRGYGTTDLAFIGQLTPTLMFRLASWPPGTPAHSQAAVEASKSEAALQSMLVAAKLLISMSIDLLSDADLLGRVRTEFAAQRSAKTNGRSIVAEF
ncbi:MAG: Amidohydrolase [Thermomicrobiales bacterium]|nr:Amidohydrolase [Thermomicrobiales bacterium]MDF3014850.1 Amidohydrolase [Thermomicrobiales bacterium]